MGKPLVQSLNECLFFTVKKLDRIMDKLAEDAFKPTGLSPTYGFIMLAIHESPGIAQKDIAQMLHTAPSTIARFADKLVNKRYIYFEYSGRNTLAYLTEQGNDLIPEIQKSWDKLHQIYADILGEEDSDNLSIHLCQIGDQLTEN